MSYVTVPDLTEHRVTLPVTVNIVPKDVAEGRVPNAQVRRSKLLLEAQTAKRESEEALRSGDTDKAREILSDTLNILSEEFQSSADAEVGEKIKFLTETLERADDVRHWSKTISASRAKKIRGYTSREQGGKVSAAPTCDACGAELKPIVYGMPSTEMFQAAERGEVILGGCNVRENQAQIGCPRCWEGWVRRLSDILQNPPT